MPLEKTTYDYEKKGVVTTITKYTKCTEPVDEQIIVINDKASKE